MTTYAAVAPVNGLASGDKFIFYTIGAGDINLITSIFGTGKPARRIQALDGGILRLIRPDGNMMQSPALIANTVLDVQVQTIEGSGKGTTATKVLVIW